MFATPPTSEEPAPGRDPPARTATPGAPGEPEPPASTATPVKTEIKEEPSQNAPPITSRSMLRTVVTERFERILSKFHHPLNYLLTKYGDPCARAAFAGVLQDTFPKRPDVMYQEGPSCPNDQTVVYLHLTDLGFGKEASTKPPPYAHTCRQLMDEYLVNNFITDGQPEHIRH